MEDDCTPTQSLPESKTTTDVMEDDCPPTQRLPESEENSVASVAQLVEGKMEDKEAETLDSDSEDGEEDNKEEQDEEEEEDEGYDEVGEEGKWQSPKNVGGSVWLTVKRDMCRLVNTNGQYQDLYKVSEKKQLTAGDVHKMLGCTVADALLKVVPMEYSQRDRIMIANAAMDNKQPNEKAAAVMLQDVRGTVLFCERKFFSGFSNSK